MAETKKAKFWNFIKKFANRYFLVALNGMAIGLFASLIIGTIFSTITKLSFLEFLKPIADVLGAKSPVYGGAIGAGIALALKHKPIVVVSSIATGALAILEGGGPVGAYLAAVVSAEVGGIIFGKTKVDIIVVPFLSILLGGIIAILVGEPIGQFMNFLGELINKATNEEPFLMGLIIAVFIGMILTAPISSAALCMSIGLNGIAAGAAAIGCSVQMIGFAVCSIKKNGFGGFISLGIGTSMLQFTNILRKPIIWLPTIIASAILGPISTCLLKMSNKPSGAGMGTCGLVGQFGAFEAMSNSTDIGIILLEISMMHFIIPAILVYGINYIFEKMKLISPEDYLLNREQF